MLLEGIFTAKCISNTRAYNAVFRLPLKSDVDYLESW